MKNFKIFSKRRRTTGRFGGNGKKLWKTKLRRRRFGRFRGGKRLGKPFYEHVSGFLNHAKNWGSAGVQALKGLNELRMMLNVEYKVFDTPFSFPVPSTGTVICLTSVIEGSDYDQRNGRSILAKSIYGRMNTTINTSATASTLRIITFIDTMNQGAIPAVTELLATASYLAPLQLANESGTRFKVLRDKTHTVSNQGTQTVSKTIYHKLHQHCKYQGVGGTAGDLLEGNLFLLAISNEPTNLPVFDSRWRFRFLDN